MSRVFVAREEALGRDVVVKVLAPETRPNGYHLAQLGEPAFARFRGDPRVRALAAELAAAQARAPSTPVLGDP